MQIPPQSDQTVCKHNILHTANVDNKPPLPEFTLGLAMLDTLFCVRQRNSWFRFLTISSGWNGICFCRTCWNLNIFFWFLNFCWQAARGCQHLWRMLRAPCLWVLLSGTLAFVQNSRSIFWTQKLLWPNIMIVHWKPVFMRSFTCQSMLLKCHSFWEGVRNYRR